MNEGSGLTVRELLPEQFDHMERTMQDALGKDSGSTGPGLPEFAWHIASSEATTAMRDSVDGDVFSLLARGWCFARELQKYRDRASFPPDERMVVFVGEHALATEMHPLLTVSVGSVDFRPIRFTLVLTANFRSAALLIQDARITGVRAGDCFVSAQLKYGDINLHNPLASRHVDFPGEIQFKPPGLPIGINPC